MSHHWQFLPNVPQRKKVRYHDEKIGQFVGSLCTLHALVGRIGHVLYDSFLSAGFWLEIMEGTPKGVENGAYLVIASRVAFLCC
jgi:hypothetical protein